MYGSEHNATACDGSPDECRIAVKHESQKLPARVGGTLRIDYLDTRNVWQMAREGETSVEAASATARRLCETKNLVCRVFDLQARKVVRIVHPVSVTPMLAHALAKRPSPKPRSEQLSPGSAVLERACMPDIHAWEAQPSGERQALCGADLSAAVPGAHCDAVITCQDCQTRLAAAW